MRRFLRIISLAGCLAVFLSASAAPSLKASIDSARILMGHLATLTVTLEHDPASPGSFPQFKEIDKSGVLRLLGDSVELRIREAKADTVKNGAVERVSIRIPVQSFDSGHYVIPSILYVTGADTLRSNTLSLDVLPVKVSANDEISPDAAVVEAPATAWQKFTDKLPDFLYYYWWLLLLLLAAIGFGIYLFLRIRKNGNPIKKKKPAPTPYEVAISELRRLRDRKLWENGNEREYFTALTDILRNYLYGRFGINAMEMTSSQIISTLSRQPDIAGKDDYVRQILSVADFVKFAKMRPLPDDSIGAFANALKFVEETKPVAAPANTENTKENKEDINA